MRVPRPAARITPRSIRESGTQRSGRGCGKKQVLFRIEAAVFGVIAGHQLAAKPVAILQVAQNNRATSESGAREAGSQRARVESRLNQFIQRWMANQKLVSKTGVRCDKQPPEIADISTA